MLKFLFSFFLVLSICFAEIQWQVSTQEISVGQTIRIDVFSSAPIKTSKIFFAGRTFSMFLTDSELNQELFHYVSYVALSRKKNSGVYPVYMKFFSEGETYQTSFNVTADHQHIKKGKVKLTKKKQKLMKKQKTLNKEAQEILAAFSIITDRAFFMKNAFILPVQGRISSKFAADRLYSGGRRRSHAGVDLVNNLGSPIVAPHSGRVVLSESYAYHGESIMIDHGYGIVSIFNHLRQRHVFVGDRVQQGELIGTLGESGLVSGAHLHWGLAVHNIRVDPLYWVNNRELSRSF